MAKDTKEKAEVEDKIKIVKSFLAGLIIFAAPIAAWELWENLWPFFIGALFIIFFIIIKLRTYEISLGKRKFVWDLSGLTAQASPIVSTFIVVGWTLPTSFNDKKDAVLMVVAIILALVSCISLAEGKFPDRLVDEQRDIVALEKRRDLFKTTIFYLGLPAFILGLVINLL